MGVRLPLSAKTVELVCYLSVREGANLQQITADLWPDEGHLEAVQLFQQGIHELNKAVTDATGWRGTIMTGPGIFAQEDPATPCPKILVRVLGEPCVELVTDD